MAETNGGSDAYKHWRESADKFDALLTAAIAATAGYIAQNLRPSQFGVNPSALEVAALVVLLFALYCSFRRHEAILATYRFDTNRKMAKAEAEHARRLGRELQNKLLAGNQRNDAVDLTTGRVATSEELLTLARDRNSEADEASAQYDVAVRSAHALYQMRSTLLLSGVTLLTIARIWAAYAR